MLMSRRIVPITLAIIVAGGLASAAEARCSRQPGFYVLFASGADACVEAPTDGSDSCQAMVSDLDASMDIWSRGGGRIELLGHTDTVGPAEANLALSERRAAYLRDLLITRGVPAGQLSIRGFGEMELARPTADDVPEPLNNRVLINLAEPVNELGRAAREAWAAENQTRLDAGLPPIPPPPCP